MLGFLAISFWNSGNLLHNIRVFSSDQLFGCIPSGPSLAESIQALGIRANGGDTIYHIYLKTKLALFLLMGHTFGIGSTDFDKNLQVRPSWCIEK
jgi:hypothetical protein